MRTGFGRRCCAFGCSKESIDSHVPRNRYLLRDHSTNAQRSFWSFDPSIPPSVTLGTNPYLPLSNVTLEIWTCMVGNDTAWGKTSHPLFETLAYSHYVTSHFVTSHFVTSHYRITSKLTPLEINPLQWDNDVEQRQTMAKMLRYNGDAAVKYG